MNGQNHFNLLRHYKIKHPALLAMSETDRRATYTATNDVPTRGQKMVAANSNQIRPHEWQHDEIRCLITAVENRPQLWLTHNLDESRKTKHEDWHNVTLEIGSNLQQIEVKSKWYALRVTFETILDNLRTNMFDKGGNACEITWPFFRPMYFLEDYKKLRSTDVAPAKEWVIEIEMLNIL